MRNVFIATLALVAGVFVVLLQAGLFGSQGQAAGEPSIGSPGVQYVDGRVLVRFEPGTPGHAMDAAHRAAGGVVSGDIGDLGVQVVEVGAGRVPAALEAYTHNPHVRYAEPDFIVHATILCEPDAPDEGGQPQITGISDDCSWRQWGLNNTGASYGPGAGTADSDIDAPEAWSLATGSGVTIAILDTGYDTTHVDLVDLVDLVDPKVVDTHDCVGETIEDFYGHGTWTATIASAVTNNNTGMAGAAPDASLMIVKVLKQNGSGTNSQIACGMNHAANYAALGNKTVISMSLGTSFCPGGGPFNCNVLKDAVNDAWAKGAVLFASAGNGGNTSEQWPAAYDKVIAVAATDDDDNKASFSTYGDWVDVAAPGVDILGAFPDCGDGSSFTLRENNDKDCNFDYGSGTSASSPLAAAVGALVWSADSNLTNVQVRAIVECTSDPVGSFVVHGRVNASAAVAAASGTPCGSSPTLVSIAVTPTSASIEEGQTQQFTAMGTYSDSSTADLTATATWGSSDTTVASIDSSGLAAGLSDGTTIITATQDGVISNDATLTVTPSSSSTVSVTLPSGTDGYATTGGRNNDKHLLITVALVDGSGGPVAGASVSIDLAHDDSPYDSATGTTGTDGTVTFQFNNFNNAPLGCYTTEVTDVTAAGLTWDDITPANGFCK